MGAPRAGTRGPSGAGGFRQVRRAAFAAVLAAAAWAAAAAPPAGPAVAFVADLRGNATFEGDGPITFLDEIPAGARLLLGTGAVVAVTFAASGTEFTLAGPGEFTLSATDVHAEKGVAPTKRVVHALADPGVVARGAREATAFASVRMRSLPAPADATRPALEFPVDTAVATLQPTLRWKGKPGPNAFTITVTDSSGREVWKGRANAPGHPVGPLAANSSYTWSVSSNEAPIGSAQFTTLPAASIERVKSLGPSKSFRDRVMRALVLQEVGAAQEAREAWKQVAAERPDLAQGLAQRR